MRHFLRESDPQGASELRRRPDPAAHRATLASSATPTWTSFGSRACWRSGRWSCAARRYRAGRRPPTGWSSRGRWYDVWQRPETGFPAVARAPAARQPASRPPPGRAARRSGDWPVWRDRAGAWSRRCAHRRSLLDATAADRPGDWRSGRRGLRAVVPASAGTLAGTVRLRHGGRYEVWVGGSFRRLVDVTAGARHFRDRHQLNHAGQWVPLGTADLRRATPPWRSPTTTPTCMRAAASPRSRLGPLRSRRRMRGQALLQVSPRRARSLCGRRLDWIEAVRPGRSVP